MTILDDIIKQRRIDIKQSKAELNLPLGDRDDVAPEVHELLMQQLSLKASRVFGVEEELGDPLDLFAAIKGNCPGPNQRKVFLAAEFKRASPSKGDICPDLDPDIVKQAVSYGSAGAGLVSILTEPKLFKGSLDELAKARRALGNEKHLSRRPLLLRKDFIFDEFQLYEARAYGADSVLLMLSVLSKEQCARLLCKSRQLGMEPLVEVVDIEEAKIALDIGAKVIGCNNRNLHTFVVDLQAAPKVAKFLVNSNKSDDICLLALSGIKAPKDVELCENTEGIDGILVGETLMRASNAEACIESLLLKNSKTQCETRVKICGITEPESALVAARAGADMIGVIFANSRRKVSRLQAKAITAAIRQYREMNEPIGIDMPDEQISEGESKGWFRVWREKIDQLFESQARPLVVGVFMNQPIEEVNRSALEAGVDIIQLHGRETKAYEAQCILPVIRVVHVDPTDRSIKSDDLVNGPAAMILLDTAVDGKYSGGSGVTFDWNITKSVDKPFFLAGGLKPENVRSAIEIGRPWGVDVSSGVEKSPGEKDHDKIRDFIRGARGQSK